MVDKIKPPNARSDQSDVWYTVEFIGSINITVHMRGKGNVEDLVSRLNAPTPNRPFTTLLFRNAATRWGMAVDFQKLHAVRFMKLSAKPTGTVMWLATSDEPPEA